MLVNREKDATDGIPLFPGKEIKDFVQALQEISYEGSKILSVDYQSVTGNGRYIFAVTLADSDAASQLKSLIWDKANPDFIYDRTLPAQRMLDAVFVAVLPSDLKLFVDTLIQLAKESGARQVMAELDAVYVKHESNNADQKADHAMLSESVKKIKSMLAAGDIVYSDYLTEGMVQNYAPQASASEVIQELIAQGVLAEPDDLGIQLYPIVKKTPGGIDFNSAHLNLQIKRDGNGVPLPISQQPLEQMQIDGFLPVIINIAPVLDLPLLLGIAQQEEEEKRVKKDLDPADEPDWEATALEEADELSVSNT